MFHYLITNRAMIQDEKGENYIREDGLDTAGEKNEPVHFALFDSSQFRSNNSCRESLHLLPTLYEVKPMTSGDVLFYVHGYRTDLNMVLEDICSLEEKYICEDSPVQIIVAISWPARKNLLHYRDDAKDAIHSGKTFARNFDLLQKFIAALYGNEGKGRIHLLAHSMGNRMLESLVLHLTLRQQKQSEAFLNEVILAAPDIDWHAFENGYALYKLSLLCQRVTVYYNEEDVALYLSQTVQNRHKRLGRHGFRDSKKVPQNVYAVDCTCINDLSNIVCHIIEHSYHTLSNYTIKDMIYVLKGTPTEQFLQYSLRMTKENDERRFVLKIEESLTQTVQTST